MVFTDLTHNSNITNMQCTHSVHMSMLYSDGITGGAKEPFETLS